MDILLKITSKFMLFIQVIFTLPILANNNSQYDIYKNELHTNRLALKDNAIWIAASKGLVKYDKTTEMLSSASTEIGVSSDIEYLAISKDRNEILWFTSQECGIIKYDNNLYHYKYTANNPSMYGLMYSMCFSYDNKLFVGELMNIAYIDPLNINPFIKQIYLIPNNSKAYLDDMVVMDMDFDSNNNLWICLKTHEYSYREIDKLYYLIKKNKEEIEQIVINAPKWPYINFNAQNILSGSKNATSLVIDKEDNIWVTSEEGMHYYNQVTKKDSLINSTTHSSIPNEYFYINEKDEEENLWFSSSTTLMKYNGTEFTTYTCDGYEEARSMLCDEDIVWVLLKNDKLLKFQNNEFETIDLSPIVTGIKESIADESNTKAYVSNGVLYIENVEDINSVGVYDTMGRVITLGTYNNNSVQIQLPSTLKGVILVKVNDEVVKTIVE